MRGGQKRNTKGKKSPNFKQEEKKRTNLKVRVKRTKKKTVRRKESSESLKEIKARRNEIKKEIEQVKKRAVNKAGYEAERMAAQRIIFHVERYKYLIMWSGVTFFMILIVIFWVYNLKINFQIYSTIKNDQNEQIKWEQLNQEIEERIDSIIEEAQEVSSTTSMIETSKEATASIASTGVDIDIDSIVE